MERAEGDLCSGENWAGDVLYQQYRRADEAARDFQVVWASEHRGVLCGQTELAGVSLYSSFSDSTHTVLRCSWRG